MHFKRGFPWEPIASHGRAAFSFHLEDRKEPENAKENVHSEQIVAKLRQIEVLASQGKTIPQGCKEVGIVEQTFYRWRKEYGGLQVEQAKKLKDLQRENGQLRRAVADLTVEKQVLKGIAEGNF